MKKSLILIILLFLLSGCGQKPSVDHPYEIKYGEKTLSYYDTGDEIDTDDFNIEDHYSYIFKISEIEKNTVTVGKDGEICRIIIIDSDVTTYKSISVGDNVKKIEKAFDNLEKWDAGYTYGVCFNSDDVEKNPRDQNKEDDWIRISYGVDDSKITWIEISDIKHLW